MSDHLARGNGAASGNGLAADEAPGEELPKTKDLEVDLHFHNQHITVLHLQEPTAAQAERADRELAGGVNAHTLRKHQIALVAAVARVDKDVIGQMKVSQLAEAYDFLRALSERGQPTGET